jgi:very-short-patch-repair endonuclease
MNINQRQITRWVKGVAKKDVQIEHVCACGTKHWVRRSDLTDTTVCFTCQKVKAGKARYAQSRQRKSAVYHVAKKRSDQMADNMTKPEQQVKEMLDQLKPVSVKPQEPLLYERNGEWFYYLLDFLVKPTSGRRCRVIEVHGEYWHKDHKEADAERARQIYRLRGWHVLVVTDKQLKRNPDRVLKRIWRFLYG